MDYWFVPLAVWALLIPSAIAAALIESPPATDWTGVALVVTASGAFLATVIGAVFTGVLALRASRKSEAAELKADAAAAAAIAAKEQSLATAKAVDGKLTEVVKLVEAKATAEATLAEKDAQKVREADAKALPPLTAAVLNGNDTEKATAVLTAAKALVQALEDAKK